jgi:catechol 2,3-dioxygenase-like lactoylglutathione lyase family enzyme
MPAPVFDHMALNVRDVAASRSFFEAALAPLGLSVVLEVPSVPIVGLGPTGKPSLMLRPGAPSGPMHVAFAAGGRELVDAFHAAALAAGGTDNGGPGIRENYHPNYYAAFVIDPDGNNVEAVCHDAVG